MTDDRKYQVRHYLCGKDAFSGCFHPLAHQFNNRLDIYIKYEEGLMPFLAFCQKDTLNMNVLTVLQAKKRQPPLATQALYYSVLNKSFIPPMLPSKLVAS